MTVGLWVGGRGGEGGQKKREREREWRRRGRRDWYIEKELISREERERGGETGGGSQHARSLTIHSEQFPTPPRSSWNSVSVMRGKAGITTQNMYSRPTPSLLPIPLVPLIHYRGQNE